MIKGSRASFDAPVAIFFFTLSLYFILTFKGYKILLTSFPLFFAFYTYIGTKILLVPFTFFIAIFGLYLNRFRYKFIYGLLVLISLGIALFFINNLRHQSGSARLSELTSPNNQQLIDLVDIDRNLTFENPLKPLLLNRYTQYFNKFIYKYFNNFSPDVLFLRGDPTYMVSLWKHGYFYLIDSVLIIFGLIYLFSSNKSFFWLAASLIALSPIPEAIRFDGIPAYAFHSAFQYPYLIILAGLGLYFLSTRIRLPVFPHLLLPIIVVFYTVSFVNFLHIYFFQYPYYQPEGFNFSRQVISHYLLELPPSAPVYILAREAESLYRNFLFYGNLYRRDTDYDFDSGRNIYTYKNYKFASKFSDIPAGSILVTEKEIDPGSYSSKPKLMVSKISDRIEMYSIYNDSLCTGHLTKTSSLDFFDLQLSGLNLPEFCQKYLLKPLDET